ncbi:MAG: hypothetical protein ACJ79K_15620 [Gemmatimonadaceae bacterium]
MTATDPPRQAHETGAIEAVEEAFAWATQTILHTAEIALALPAPAASRWHRAGIGARGERIFDVVAGIVLMLFAIGWTWSIAVSHAGGDDDVTDATASISAALTDPNAPTAAYVTDAMLSALTPLRGTSGKLRASVTQPGQQVDTMHAGDSADAELRVATQPSDTGAPVAPARAGIWGLAVKIGAALKPVTDFSVITVRPFSEKQRGRIGLYYIGSWPTEHGAKAPAKAPADRYAPPRGLIEVTQENQDTPLSDHFRLRDFLTHDQENVWPKYIVLDLKLVDKLELVLSDLESRGYNATGVHVMSGFRTPQYNVTGGDPTGRAALSRHMYGDAADIFIDNDGNGVMDDLNHDHRVNIRDSQVILAAVDRVERDHPELVGGAGVYVANGGHGPFIHIDTRGFRARWVGTGDD